MRTDKNCENCGRPGCPDAGVPQPKCCSNCGHMGSCSSGSPYWNCGDERRHWTPTTPESKAQSEAGTVPCRLVLHVTPKIKQMLETICRRSEMSRDVVIAELINHHKNDRLRVVTQLVIEPDELAGAAEMNR